MTAKLQAYEKALTLFGRIFSQTRNRGDRYFLATIKFDFVFFIFALICEKEKDGFKRSMRFFPRNFNEWRFGRNFILFDDSNPRFWDIDKEYFSQEKIINPVRKTEVRGSNRSIKFKDLPSELSNGVKRSGEKIAILTCGLDLDKFSSLEELIEKEKVGAVIDWKGGLKQNSSLKVIQKSRVFSISCFYFFIKQAFAIFKIYRCLKKLCKTNCSLPDFLRYFIYYAFHSARIRYFMKVLSRDSSIGKVFFSDIDNAWGNSFMLWSHFYGFSQIVYTHGSSLYLNQHRYFDPAVYLVYTAYHEKVIKNAGLSSRILVSLPGWLKKNYSIERTVKDAVRNIAFITGMEKNLEVPFGDKEMLLSYLEDLSRFACQKNLSLLLKSHKLLDWHKEYDDFSEKFRCVRHIKERWNQQDIGQIDLGVLAVTESTLALQLLHAGIPVITCLELVSEIWTKHFSAPHFQFVVKTKMELLEIVNRFLNDKEFYQRSRREAFSIFNSIINRH